MKLAISKQGAVVGGTAGALAGFFLDAFGMSEISGVLSPSQVVLFSLLFGVFAGLLGGHRLMLSLDAALVFVYVAVAYTPIMGSLAPRWVRSDRVPATADAIVVLSAAVLSNSALNANGTERLLSGLELFQRGVAPRLLTTHIETEYPGGLRSSTPDQARLVALAGATAAWTVLDSVVDTRDEALRAAAKLPDGARRIVVVTSPLHTRRACATFATVGFTVTCYPARGRLASTWRPLVARDRIAAFADYLYERLGMVKYRWRHWVSSFT
jgi:uncharacterized SAM-binding protein YcdF (DUF218 family)